MKYVIYKDASGSFRWRLVHLSNGKTIADSGQGYTARADCEHGIALTKASASAPVEG